MAHDARDQLLETLLDGAPLGIAVVDRGWRVTRVNQRAAAFLGTTPEALVGHDLWEGARLKGTGYEAPCRKAMKERTAGRFEEKAAAGAALEVHVAPAKDGLVLWWLDVSERGRAAEKTLRLRALAHDLRTPLTVIGLNAELLAAMAGRRGDDAEQQKAEAVSRAAEQLSEIAHRLSATLREGTK